MGRSRIFSDSPPNPSWKIKRWSVHTKIKLETQNYVIEAEWYIRLFGSVVIPHVQWRSFVWKEA